MLNSWFAPIVDSPVIAMSGITPRSFPGKTSGMLRPSAERRLRSALWLVSAILLLENWNCSSFSFDDRRDVERRIAAATWPGTLVSVVATFGTARPRNSPPGSSVKLLSCV